MNVQKSLYQCLVRLGVDMTDPQGYVSIPLDCNQKLVFGLMKRVGGYFYVLLSHYRLEGRQLIPEPEVVVQVSPSNKKATVMSRTWKNDREEASPGLDLRVFAWMEAQLLRGYRFQQLRSKRQENNVIAFRRSHVNSLLVDK